MKVWVLMCYHIDETPGQYAEVEALFMTEDKAKEALAKCEQHWADSASGSTYKSYYIEERTVNE